MLRITLIIAFVFSISLIGFQTANAEVQPIQYDADLDTLSAECSSLVLEDEYEKAIKVCEDLLSQTDPTSAYYSSALHLLSLSYNVIGNYDKAILYEGILYEEERLELDPNNFNALTALCSLHIDAGNLKEAKTYAEKAKEIDPDNGLLGKICLQRLGSMPAEQFDIKPILSNGYITKYEFKSNALTLGLTDVVSDAEMQVHLPRELIDAKEGNQDILFEVAIDTKRVIYDEILTTSSERVLRFSVPSDTNWIKITGTESYSNAVVVPEFHEIAIMVLGSGIIGIIVVSKKFGILKNS